MSFKTESLNSPGQDSFGFGYNIIVLEQQILGNIFGTFDAQPLDGIHNILFW